jgi:hypothetical protein
MSEGLDLGPAWPPPRHPDFSMDHTPGKFWPWTATTLVGPGFQCLCTVGFTRKGTARRHRKRLALDWGWPTR